MYVSKHYEAKRFFFCWKLNRVELICIAVAICNDFAFAGVVRECPIGRAVRAYCWVFLQCFLFRCLHSREKGYQLHGSAEARTAKKAKKAGPPASCAPRRDSVGTLCSGWPAANDTTTDVTSRRRPTRQLRRPAVCKCYWPVKTRTMCRLQMLLVCQNQNYVMLRLLLLIALVQMSSRL